MTPSIKEIAEIVGHVPTERVFKLIKALEKSAKQYCKEHPDTDESTVWATIEGIIHIAIEKQRTTSGGA